MWQPLLALYRRIGDEKVLEAKLGEAIECTFDASFRAELRLERARLLEPTRPDEAATELEEVLHENEEARDAAALLTRIYERQGREEDLAALIERRLSVARSHDDAAEVLALSLRLGAIFAKDKPEQAIEVYRAALDVAPDSVEILGRLLALFEGDDRAEDRAEVLEKMLALAKGREAADRALGLADLLHPARRRGRRRARARRSASAPTRAWPELRDRLAALYTSQRALGRAGRDARGRGREPRRRRRRASPARGGGALPRPARPARRRGARPAPRLRARSPADVPLLVDLARCLARAGDLASAVGQVGAALDRGVAKRADRVLLLRLRAELSTAPEDQDRALEDLETAHRLDPAGVARDLVEAIERRRASWQERRAPPRGNGRSCSAWWRCCSSSTTRTAHATRWATT